MSSEVTSLRALAHPTRQQIVELLHERPSMTATECAGVLHLSPKTASYHLQTLASSGFVEEVPVPGRNRPWRLVAPAAPEQPATGRSLARKSVRERREESLLDGAADAITGVSGAWTETATVHTRVATMTPAEVDAWVDEIERVTSRHVRRSATPDGTARVAVRLLFCGFPTPKTPH
jgi:predicted ArsR family transcriptional regulator